ncbi:MAG: type II secretion system protein [Planctomycetota bacterium]|jgi:prepilin-type N-terminal cleavage/methylation domain-containing protein
MNRKRGFTLIELLVVIAIIALLMGILLPALRSVKEHAKRAVCLSHVKSLITGVHAYAADYDGDIPASIEFMNASWNFFCWQSYDDPPRWILLGRLYGTGIIKDPEIFYCPSQKNEILKKGRREEEGGGWNWTTSTGNESRAISYHYGLLAEIRSAPELEMESMKLSALKNRALICDAFMPFNQGPVWAHPKGLTTGFAAGHVEFIKVDREVADIAEQIDNEGWGMDQRDLFTAAMFELLAGRSHVMDQYFLRTQ